MKMSQGIWIICLIALIGALAACSVQNGMQSADEGQSSAGTQPAMPGHHPAQRPDAAQGPQTAAAQPLPAPTAQREKSGYKTIRRSAGPAGISQADTIEIEEVVVTASAVRSRDPDHWSRHRSSAPAPMAAKPSVLSQPEDLVQRLSAELQLGSSVMPGEELWIIAKADDPERARDDLGTGALLCACDDKQIPMPLEHTAVSAAIDGFVSSVNVRQSFGNPFDSKIEAVYMFPLPQDAAVSEFVMVIGERRIRGILREKQEAERIYQAARSQGLRASLLVQHRPNVFEQRVANIEPGQSIEVDITYFSALAYRDGWYSFVFPTVVGPRFNPPGTPNPIAAVPRSSSPGVAISYLAPNERSGHDISISVKIDAGVSIEEVRASHNITASDGTDGTLNVALASGATIPNRDFVLDFRVAGDTMKSNLITHWDDEKDEGYFAMMLYPPAASANLARRPMELVFVLDCSGSMRGQPMAQAKAAMRSALTQLQPADTFQIIRFSENASALGAAPLPATQKNIRRGQRFVQKLSGTGGTMMIEGIKAALDFPHDPERLRFVTFMTDGYIGNEAQILAAMHERIGAARVFSFGVGSSTNRYLMERMAKVGRGVAAFLPMDADAGLLMDQFFARISRPALTDLDVHWGNMLVRDVYPASLPDLFVGRPVFVTGRYSGSAEFVAVTGQSRAGEQRLRVEVEEPGSARASLGKIWARKRIAELSDQQSLGHDPYGEVAARIRDTALAHQLMSAYTSFVAVDSSVVTDGNYGTTVHQAVPVPAGVRYNTTVPGGG